MAKDPILEDLNPAQKEAILHTKGPLLVVAGAGSGKTRVITRKFIYLAKRKNYHPSSILTVTFTNKAASEMKERIAQHINGDARHAWIGTFHSQCCKILRKEIKALGYKPDFTIYDDDDQTALIKMILKDFKMYEALSKNIASKISFLKSSLITPEEFLASIDEFSNDERIGRVYMRYQSELKKCNAVDFDDLIALTVKLLREHPEVLQRYNEQFPYVLVDEFQDINHSQYELIKLLCRHNNICAVGDDDQSIYKFRGADVTNILNFTKDFPNAQVIKLEQNYRSTQNILDVSGAVISKNEHRRAKRLWTDRGCGDKVRYCLAETEEEEAKHVARMIKDLYLMGKYEFGQCAILYRINLQARALEDALRDASIPYTIINGISFYHRKEIKDILAYMRLALNSSDNISFRRIINVPHRGIGASTLTKIEAEAKKHSLSLLATLKMMLKSDSTPSALKLKIKDFSKLIDRLAKTEYKNAGEMLKDIVSSVQYLENLEEDRIANIMELISSAEAHTVKEFADRVSLVSTSDGTTSNNAVSLMTLHTAKGLEFPVVFIVGVEEGILPYFKSHEDPMDLQEERRLMYVGMTRAKEVLVLSGARRRKLYSRTQIQEPSRFLRDIPRECCHWNEKEITSKQSTCTIAESPLSKLEKPSQPTPKFIVGCRVRHPSWGIGVIRDSVFDGSDEKVTVNFPGIGIKKLSTRYASLEMVK